MVATDKAMGNQASVGPDIHIRSGLTQMLLRVATRAGFSREVLLTQAGVSERELEDPDAQLPFETHRRIGVALLSRLPPAGLPQLMREVVSPSTFGIAGKIAQNCETVHDALLTLVRYQRLFFDGAVMTLERARDSVVFAARVPAIIEQLRQPLFAIFASVLTLARQLAGVELAPIAVTFALRADAEELDRLTSVFGVPPRFNEPSHTIVFEPRALAIPVVGARGDHAALLSSYADDLLAEAAASTGVTADVSRVLVTALPRGIVQRDLVARELGMSSRTLSRRLSAEATTFGQILESVRRDLAQRYLRDHGLSIHEVAFLLGYTEPSTFFRAFKRWTGRTPAKWRASAGAT